MPKAKTTTKNKKSKVSKQEVPLVDAAAAEKWDLVRKICSTENIVCRLDSCKESAEECWASNLNPDDLWHMCSSCVESEFGPEAATVFLAETSTENPSLDPPQPSAEDKRSVLPMESTENDTSTRVSDGASEDDDKRPCGSNESIDNDSMRANDDAANRESDDDNPDQKAVVSQVFLPTQNDAPMNESRIEPSQEATAIGSTVQPRRICDEAPADAPLTSKNFDTSMEDTEEGWDLKKVMLEADLVMKNPIVCQSCHLVAAVVYVSTLTKNEWYCCLDCQFSDYGGWPEKAEEIPIKAMSAKHKKIMTQKCSLMPSPTFPDFSEVDRDMDITRFLSPAPSPTSVADDVNELDQVEAEESWDLKKVMSFSDLSKDSTIKCSNEFCVLAAATMYVSTHTKEKWYACIDCQENDYGGWPETLPEIPIQSMTDNHKQLMAKKCSRQSRPVFPVFTQSPTKTLGTTNSLTPPPNGTNQVTPTPGPKAKPSAQAMAIHRKWQAAAEAVGGPDVRIVVEKTAAKKLIFDYLYDAFRPMNITQIHTGLKAIVPSPVLKQSLDDMALAQEGDCILFTESDDEEIQAKKKQVINTTDEFAGVLAYKAGRNSNTCLYYVDHSKQKNNGNGLEHEARGQLYTSKALAEEEERQLKHKLKMVEEEAKRLNSEPTNEEAAAKLEIGEAIMKDLRAQLEDSRKLKANEQHKLKTKRSIEGMTTQWRKRRRICMDFLFSMEEITEGTISVKKSLAGDGQIDIESDEKATKDSKTFAENKRALRRLNAARKSSMGKKEATMSSRIVADENFIGVELDSQGKVRRVYLDERF